MQKQICLIEPFFSGSHKEWALGLQTHSKYKIQILDLPGRHWKWRMEGAAIHFAKLLNEKSDKPDLFLVTDMLDLAVFKSLLKSELLEIPIVIYFHENQFDYPSNSKKESEEFHFAWKNYTSALTADQILFNSNYNRNTFFEGVESLLKRLPDYTNIELVKSVREKASVLPLGLNLPNFNSYKKSNPIPTIVWNHRWEHDKGPESFFQILFELKQDGFQFRLKVLGESFSNSPAIFSEAKELLKKEILFFGFAESKDEYWMHLQTSDILPVTSKHDFFGISVAEAIHAGVYPILPIDLAYPELIDPKVFSNCFYSDFSDLKSKIIQFNSSKKPSPSVSQFSWEKMIDTYDLCFSEVLKYNSE